MSFSLEHLPTWLPLSLSPFYTLGQADIGVSPACLPFTLFLSLALFISYRCYHRGGSGESVLLVRVNL